MGQTLSEPVTTKRSASGEDELVYFGVSDMQGWRLSMEDAHAHVLGLAPSGRASTSKRDQPVLKSSFFAVYDGHGGAAVAKFSGETVHVRLAESELYKDGKWEEALRQSFLATDEALRANPDYNGDPSGCTAVATLITHDGKIVCANAGDSRAVLSVGGEAKPLSYDHKPVNRTENSRIVAAGGFVEFGRVNGNLALSRAIGDFEFKNNKSLSPEAQIVTSNPDLVVHPQTAEDEFIILACDGIWDVLNSQQVVDVVRRQIGEKIPLDKICENLMDKCLAPDSDWGGIGCDNMTVMIVGLLNGRTKDEWYNWMAERVEKGVGRETPKDSPQPFSRQNRGVLGYGGALNRGGPLSGTLSGGYPSPFGGDNSNEEDGTEADFDDSETEGGTGLTVEQLRRILASQGYNPGGGLNFSVLDDDDDEDEGGIMADARFEDATSRLMEVDEYDNETPTLNQDKKLPNGDKNQQQHRIDLDKVTEAENAPPPLIVHSPTQVSEKEFPMK